MAERQCDLLTITDFEEPEDPKRRRRAIVMTARVHPGETPASWIMKGFLDFVTGFACFSCLGVQKKIQKKNVGREFTKNLYFAYKPVLGSLKPSITSKIW